MVTNLPFAIVVGVLGWAYGLAKETSPQLTNSGNFYAAAIAIFVANSSSLQLIDDIRLVRAQRAQAPDELDAQSTILLFPRSCTLCNVLGMATWFVTAVLGLLFGCFTLGVDVNSPLFGTFSNLSAAFCTTLAFFTVDHDLNDLEGPNCFCHHNACSVASAAVTLDTPPLSLPPSHLSIAWSHFQAKCRARFDEAQTRV